MIKKFFMHIGLFGAVLAVLWTALVLTSFISNESISANMEKSALSYDGAEAFSFGTGGYNSVTDNYADVILLNVMWNIDSADPFVSSLDTKYFNGNDGMVAHGENWGFYAAVNGAEPNTDYSRYWHGSVVFLRPLMLLTDVNGIKLIGMWAAVVLLALNSALLIGKRQYFAAAALTLSFICVQVWNIRLSLEYHPAILVTLAVLPLFVIFEKRGDTALTLLSVASGVMIAFFDFLTSETLTILIPLVIVLIIRKQEDRLFSTKTNIILIVKCGAAWVLSYGGTFLVKWIAASLVTGENKFVSALSSAGVRFYGEAEELSPIKQIIFAPLANISAVFGGDSRVDAVNIIIGLGLSVLILGGYYFLFRKKKKDKTFVTVMLLPGLLPYFRYVVLSNHSYLHSFFTYRAQAATVLALFAIVWFSTEIIPKTKKSAAKNGKVQKNER